MRFSEQAKSQVIRLIYQGENLDPFDLEALYAWMHASYEALGFDSAYQERFAEYCGSCSDSTPVRLYKAVWVLKQALREDDALDNSQPTYSQA